MADIIVTKKIRKPRTKKADMIKKKEAEKGVEATSKLERQR